MKVENPIPGKLYYLIDLVNQGHPTYLYPKFVFLKEEVVSGPWVYDANTFVPIKKEYTYWTFLEGKRITGFRKYFFESGRLELREINE